MAHCPICQTNYVEGGEELLYLRLGPDALPPHFGQNSRWVFAQGAGAAILGKAGVAGVGGGSGGWEWGCRCQTGGNYGAVGGVAAGNGCIPVGVGEDGGGIL